MAATIEVKSYDPLEKAKREALAQRVVQEFGSELADLKLLAFFDNGDDSILRQELGLSNRGFYAPVKRNNRKLWPPEMALLIFPSVYGVPWEQTMPGFEHGIYLHGTTCSDEIPLVMTFAHELQHCLQYVHHRKLWAESRLIPLLPKTIQGAERLNWPDVPHEREARIVAKRVAVCICGAEAVKRYIERKLAESQNQMGFGDLGDSIRREVEDWRFIRDLDPCTPYDPSGETSRIFQRLRRYRPELEDVLREERAGVYKEEYSDVDLSVYFNAPP